MCQAEAQQAAEPLVTVRRATAARWAATACTAMVHQAAMAQREEAATRSELARCANAPVPLIIGINGLIDVNINCLKGNLQTAWMTYPDLNNLNNAKP